MSYPVWTPGAWIFDKNFPIAVDGVPVAQPNFTDSATVQWVLDPNTMQVTANFANGAPASSTFVYTGTVDPVSTAGLLTGSLYLNTVSGSLFQLQVVGSQNTWVVVGTITPGTTSVSSVFGRTGAITGQFGDYNFNELTGVATPSQVPTLNQIPGTISTSQLTGAITSSQLPFPVTSGNVNNIVTVDGVIYPTVQQALSAIVPLGGGVIDMRGNSASAALALGTIDVGNNGPALTLLLGPYNYTCTQIVMRTGTKIFGTGFTAGTSIGTTITATNSTQPLIVANTNASTDNPSQHIELKDISFIGAANGTNTSDGMFFDASVSTTGLGGVWYSQFSGLTFSKFAGNVIHLKGPSVAGHNGDNQWLTFLNCTVFRTQGGGNALRIEGTNNFITFINSELDGYAGNAVIDPTSTPNIFIGGGPGGNSAGSPYIIDFIDTAIQGSNVLVQIDGGYSIKFNHCHHEAANGVFHITQNQNGANVPTVGLLIEGESFNGNVGVNSGNGYIMQIDAGASVTNVTLKNSIYPSSGAGPDHWLINNSSGSSGLVFSDNSYGGGAGAAGAGTHIPIDGPIQVSANVSFLNMGTGPVVDSITGTDKAFTMLFTTGTGTPLDGAGITINFAEPNFSQPPVCIATRADAEAEVFRYAYNLPGSTSNMVFSTVGTAPAASTQYGMTVICVGKPV